MAASMPRRGGGRLHVTRPEHLYNGALSAVVRAGTQRYAASRRRSNSRARVEPLACEGTIEGMAVALPAPIGNWITVDEAAKRLGMTTGGVHTLVRRKQLKRYRFGRAAAFLDADVAKVADRTPTTGRPRKGYAPRTSKPAR